MSAPIGNKNAAKGAEWRFALKDALETFADPALGIQRGDALKKIAMECIKDAFSPDPRLRIPAREEIANRLDGKPKQAIVGGDEGDSPVQVEGRIKLVKPEPSANE